MTYFRPLIQTDLARPEGAETLNGGPAWFTHAEVLSRDKPAKIIPAKDIPKTTLDQLTKPCKPICGLSLDRPRIMGILNTTPDSFSDGGKHASFTDAVAHCQTMLDQGADIIDIGGESTRPGADFVPADQEIARTIPVIAALKDAGVTAPLSIDTRKAAVADAALSEGAAIFNDVTALSYDAASATVAANHAATVCLMHAQGDPKTMQADPHYNNVLLDVYDYLLQRVKHATAMGIARDQIMIDVGIGFGKTQSHNLELLRNISLFHGLGCPILLGVSRKRFIGVIGGAQEAADRAPGSVALALHAIAQGVQIVRVHDVGDTRQAIAVWQATTGAGDRQ